MKVRTGYRSFPWPLALTALAWSGCNLGAGPIDPRTGREVGATSFISADSTPGAQSQDNRNSFTGEAATGEAADNDAALPGSNGSDRTVEEGDIYRPMGSGLVANLNAYRGLQILDLSNPSAPAILGSLQISGSPVELYLVDQKAVVLMNNWYGYYGEMYASSLSHHQGGVVAVIDLSNPAQPTLLHQAPVSGSISTSRLTRDGSQIALYVAAGGVGGWADGGSGSTQTVVKSFDLSAGLVAKSELSLGGYVSDIQATPQALLVASYDWTTGSGASLVTVVDISDPAGTMLQGDTISVAGRVSSQFNLDLHGNILRVVSGSTWGGTNTNHLQTYDATDLQNLVPIDHDTFGQGEDLYATLFLGEKAFFVTYRRVDPFHAFHIDSSGQAQEKSEFVVSGWNDFFKPAAGETRLVGVGVDDAQGWKLALSLYDITDLTNTNPLIVRAHVDASTSWSEANWDHRAFSVLEDVVQVTSPGGTPETGLVLLPFSGWDDASNTYQSGVQIFSFSATTLTRRGVMQHGSHVRRSFLAQANATANISEEALSLFDTHNPDEPTELGRLDLAPNYTDYIVFGSHAVRFRDNAQSGWWYGSQAPASPATAEIVPAHQHPDQALAVATLSVPAGAKLHKVGNHLVSVSSRYTDVTRWPYPQETTITVWDLSTPTQPQKVSTLVTDRLRDAGGYGGGWGYADCFGCGMPYGGGWNNAPQTAALDAGLAFLQKQPQQQLLGQEEICSTYPTNGYGCWNGASDSCTHYTGSINCVTFEGNTACYGEIYRCTASGTNYTCEAANESNVPTRQSCHTYDKYRYWDSYSLEVLDLSQPAAPTFTAPLALSPTDEGVGMLSSGNSVWLSYKRPVQVSNDSRPYVAYYAQRFDLTQPAQPAVGPGVNVPGELFEIDGDTLYTRDLLWGQNIVETSVAKLSLKGSVAVLEAIHAFPNRVVEAVAADGAGHLLVSHSAPWSMAVSSNLSSSQEHQLSVLSDANLAVLSEVAVASWAQLESGQAGRGLFQVPGGFLVFNLSNPAQPYPQAYLPARGWPQSIHVQGDNLVAPAGRYGIYRFNLGEFNLLPPAL